MFTLKKSAIICIATLMFFIAAPFWGAAQSPKYSGTITLQGLQQTVDVYFDNYGIPHIYAKSIEDAYYAFGYLHAQERISQFEFFRRLGTGTFSEVLGAAGLPFDVPNRTFGIVENAKRSAKKLREGPNTNLKKSLTSYLAGVNAYLTALTPTTRPKDLLPTPQKYTLEDIYATLGNFLFGFPALGVYSDAITDQLKNILNNPAYFDELKVLKGRPVNRSFPPRPGNFKNISRIYKRTHKPMGKKLMKALTGLPSRFGHGLKNSNGWALSGKKTKTNKPFHSSDTHIPLSKPDIYYEAHIVYPGQDLYGLFFPFTTLSAIGFNRNISWGITSLLNDDIDLYREKINPANPNQVWENNHWVDMKIRQETIKILQADGSLKDSVIDVKVTRHGPIINDVEGLIIDEEPISMFYVGFQFEDSILESFFGINNAKNLQGFRKSVRKLIAPGFNLQYADKQGNIAWFAAAKLLKRADHVNSKLILDGASGKDEPLGYYPFKKNPRSINPPAGFIYSANNQIDKVDGVLYPGYYVAGTRAKRIKKLLRKKKKFSSSDLQKLFNEDVSPVFRKVSRELLRVLKNNPVLTKTPDHRMVARILANWKGKHQLHSKGPIVYYQLYYQLLKGIFEDEVGADLFSAFFVGDTPLYDVLDRSFANIYFNPNSIWFDDVSTANIKEKRRDIFAKAFDITVGKLVQRGHLSKTWGELHQQTYIGLPASVTGQQGFNLGPYPFTGGVNVLNKTELDLSLVNSAGNYNVAKTNGPNNRNLVDFSDPARKSFGVLPTGQSGFPNSPFYKDQVPLYNNGKLRRMLRNKQEIKKVSTQLILKNHRKVK